MFFIWPLQAPAQDNHSGFFLKVLRVGVPPWTAGTLFRCPKESRNLNCNWVHSHTLKKTSPPNRILTYGIELFPQENLDIFKLIFCISFNVGIIKFQGLLLVRTDQKGKSFLVCLHLSVLSECLTAFALTVVSETEKSLETFGRNSINHHHHLKQSTSPFPAGSEISHGLVNSGQTNLTWQDHQPWASWRHFQNLLAALRRSPLTTCKISCSPAAHLTLCYTSLKKLQSCTLIKVFFQAHLASRPKGRSTYLDTILQGMQISALVQVECLSVLRNSFFYFLNTNDPRSPQIGHH